MKRILLLSSILILAITVSAQSISVSSFKLLESDLTANTAGTTERDQNGEVAALIKVVTTQTGFSFDAGSLGIVKTKQTPGEIWVYIPHGAKKITIKHPQLGVLRDYLVTPTNAVVELNNEILPTSDGIAQKFVKLGSYEYRIQAPNYHTSAGIVAVDDPNNKKMLEINLAPAFGWIEIPANPEYNGAQVYIDNALVGTIPMKSQNLPSGEHDIKIVKALYNPYSQKVLVKDNETSQVTPNLSANFSEVTISVDNDADIYVNGELKTKGSWTGKLESGSYLMEAKKENYRSTSQSVDISAVNDKQTIQLSAPIPIYGTANITSTPAMADVFIDGKNMGQTPLFISNLLIGNHTLEIRSGTKVFHSSIIIDEATPYQINAILNNKRNVLRVLSYHLELNEIHRSSTSTDLYFTYHVNSGDWLYISPKAYIKSNYDNKKYILLDTQGIPMLPQKTRNATDNDVHFILKFSPIPENTTEIEFYEPDSSWQFKGIKL